MGSSRAAFGRPSRRRLSAYLPILRGLAGLASAAIAGACSSSASAPSALDGSAASSSGASGSSGSSGATSSSGSGTPSDAASAATGSDAETGDASGSGGSSGASDAAPRPRDSGGDAHKLTGPVHIMPLGDSITGSTCYPQLLSKELIGKGRTNFAFVGTNTNNQACGTGAPTVQTEGHGGYLVTYLTTNSPPQTGKGTLAELQTWAAEKPDVVLMEYGTNDVWSSIATANVLGAYGFVVDQFRSQNPNVIFFVAQITPLHPSGCTSCESNVEALNAQIPSWAAGKATAVSPIYVVNVWSALPAATYVPNSMYTADGVHPNPAGSQLMADVWYAGVTAQGIP
jgi:lysophospholipase L1-like esterase